METLFKKNSQKVKTDMRKALKLEGPDREIEFKFQVKNFKEGLNVVKKETRQAITFVGKYEEALKALRGPVKKTANELKTFFFTHLYRFR